MGSNNRTSNSWEVLRGFFPLVQGLCPSRSRFHPSCGLSQQGSYHFLMYFLLFSPFMYLFSPLAIVLCLYLCVNQFHPSFHFDVQLNHNVPFVFWLFFSHSSIYLTTEKCYVHNKLNVVSCYWFSLKSTIEIIFLLINNSQ